MKIQAAKSGIVFRVCYYEAGEWYYRTDQITGNPEEFKSQDDARITKDSMLMREPWLRLVIQRIETRFVK